MAVKLPIKQPPITSYQQIALPLTVAMVNPTAENWFYSILELSINVQSKNTQNLKQPYRPYLLSASSTAEVRAG